jgi:GntR family transcriptional regulator
MGVDRSSDRPVYKQVADALRAAIRSGQLADEQALPSETQLMRQYGVSRNSVRTAVSLLRVEGLVVTEHGRGSFVRAGHTRQRSDSSGYAKARWQARHSAQTEAAETEGAGQQLFGGEVTPPPQEVASRLGLGSGECVLIHRHLVLCGGEPAQLAGYFPLRLPAQASDEQAESLSEGAHVRLERVVEELSVRMPSLEEARRLGIGASVPVVRVLRTLYDASGAALEVVDFVLVGDGYVVAYELSAD